MSANTKIEWATHTFNGWIGCTEISPGCDHCYAKSMMDTRLGVAVWGAGQPRVRTSKANWTLPLKWNANAKAFAAENNGLRQRVFCSSLADVFDNEVPQRWRQDLFDLILATPNLDWLLLTKRIGNAMKMLNEVAMCRGELLTANDEYRPPANVWIGATIVNPEEARRDIIKLLKLPAAKRFLSMEPLLAAVNLNVIDIDGHSEIYPLHGTTGCADEDGRPLPDLPALDWVIVGGESGLNARPMHPDWVRNLRDQCTDSFVPFLFKQWGEFAPNGRTFAEIEKSSRKAVMVPINDQDIFPAAAMDRVGKKAAGRLLDGREWNEVPTYNPSEV